MELTTKEMRYCARDMIRALRGEDGFLAPYMILATIDAKAIMTTGLAKRSGLVAALKSMLAQLSEELPNDTAEQRDARFALSVLHSALVSGLPVDRFTQPAIDALDAEDKKGTWLGITFKLNINVGESFTSSNVTKEALDQLTRVLDSEERSLRDPE